MKSATKLRPATEAEIDNAPVYRNLPGVLSVSVGGVTIAGATDVNRGISSEPKWLVMSAIRFAGANQGAVEPVQCRNEEHAREWLTFLANLFASKPAAFTLVGAA